MAHDAIRRRGNARFRDDLAFVHNYRFFFGFDARTGDAQVGLQPPRRARRSRRPTSATRSPFVTADGELGALDARTGARTFAAKLPGEVVRGATFDAEGWAPRRGRAARRPLLRRAVDDRRRIPIGGSGT